LSINGDNNVSFRKTCSVSRYHWICMC